MSALIEVCSSEAKTHLPEFLRKVREGSAFRITQRGEPIADLVPIGVSERQTSIKAARRMRQFMLEQTSVKTIDTKALMEEGRD